MKFTSSIFSKKNIIVSIVVLLSLALSFVIYLANFPGVPRVFIFESSDSQSLSIEKRFLPSNPHDGKIQNYVSELLLGPVSEHCKPVFALGTTVLSCFEKDGTLYVNLSKDLLRDDIKNADYRKKISLFEKNIKVNFHSVKEVCLFIDGHKPFEF